jgi:hypothetical protein
MDIKTLQRLAGITEFQGYKQYTPENVSITGTEKRRIEREQGIKPGTDEWFELWFSKPHLTGHTFRGRNKK